MQGSHSEQGYCPPALAHVSWPGRMLLLKGITWRGCYPRPCPKQERHRHAARQRSEVLPRPVRLFPLVSYLCGSCSRRGPNGRLAQPTGMDMWWKASSPDGVCALLWYTSRQVTSARSRSQARTQAKKQANTAVQVAVQLTVEEVIVAAQEGAIRLAQTAPDGGDKLVTPGACRSVISSDRR